MFTGVGGVKWNYCVAMVITDGLAVAEVISFGSQLGSIFGQTAQQLHQ